MFALMDLNLAASTLYPHKGQTGSSLIDSRVGFLVFLDFLTDFLTVDDFLFNSKRLFFW